MTADTKSLRYEPGFMKMASPKMSRHCFQSRPTIWRFRLSRFRPNTTKHAFNSKKTNEGKAPTVSDSVTEELKALRREVKRMTLSPQPAADDGTSLQLNELGRHLDRD